MCCPSLLQALFTQMYMVPEGYQSGALRVYIAEEFPLKWRFLAKLHPQPLIDASIVEFEGRWWLFATDAVSVAPCGCGVWGVARLRRSAARCWAYAGGGR